MLAQTPPMGWNSWNTFTSEINEAVVCESADAMVSTGLKDAGYEYVVIDDCWSERMRDPVTHRIVPNKKKFPRGIKYVADYVHSKGLKFGIYSCCGVRTCADFPGSFDHEFLDAQTFAEWGVDFLKYDNCQRPSTADSPLLYRRMGHALRFCGREILFSACNWGSDNVWAWIRSAGAHMYRSTGDIRDSFESMRELFHSQIPATERINLDERDPKSLAASVRAAGGTAAHAPGCFNDIDMLTVGMFGKGTHSWINANGNNGATEYKTQFAAWCFFGSPLMLGADIRNLDPEMLELVKNPGLIALNQDPEFRPAFKCDNIAYARLLAGGDIAIGFFNTYDDDACGRLYLDRIGIPFSAGFDLNFTNVMTGENIGPQREYVRFDLKKHDSIIFRATPVPRKN